MYRADLIKDGLLHLIGWRQHYNTSEFTISDSLTESTSGLFFQDFHPMLNLAMLKQNSPNFSAIAYPDWAAGTQYRVGDRVSLAAKNYRAKLANKAKSPEINPTEWERFDAFSEWLEEKTKASIMRAISSLYTKKLSDKTLNSILENRALFNGAGRLSDTVANNNSLVGFEIVPIRTKGATVRIERIGLQFSAPGDTEMYLFHSSQPTPVKTITFTRQKSGGMEWFRPTEELYLPNFSEGSDFGGSWYLVYDQNALPASTLAINKNKDWSTKPCFTCDSDEYTGWQIWSRFLEVHPFKIYGANPAEMFDVAECVHTYDCNYGINLELTILCDLTDIILEQKGAFQDIIGLQVACDMLREIAYNSGSRINREQVVAANKMELLYELDGDSQSYKKSGLAYQLSKAMDAVSIDLKAMGSVCLPCGNKGLKFRTV